MESLLTPLADYFWIAGVETISYDDVPWRPSPQADKTIDEHSGSDSSKKIIPSSTTRANACYSRQSCVNRLFKVSNDSQDSVKTLEEPCGNGRCNRSSTAIRPAGGGSNGIRHDHSIGDLDFDKALLKLSTDWKNFLDMSFSAGAKLQARPPTVNSRVERIKADGSEFNGRNSPLRSITGSIRRKMSFRDMNGVRKSLMAPRTGGLPVTPTIALCWIQSYTDIP